MKNASVLLVAALVFLGCSAWVLAVPPVVSPWAVYQEGTTNKAAPKAELKKFLPEGYSFTGRVSLPKGENRGGSQPDGRYDSDQARLVIVTDNATFNSIKDNIGAQHPGLKGFNVKDDILVAAFVGKSDRPYQAQVHGLHVAQKIDGRRTKKIIVVEVTVTEYPPYKKNEQASFGNDGVAFVVLRRDTLAKIEDFELRPENFLLLTQKTTFSAIAPQTKK